MQLLNKKRCRSALQAFGQNKQEVGSEHNSWHCKKKHYY